VHEYSNIQEQRFGSQTKLRQLTVVCALLSALYAILKAKQWRAQIPLNEHITVDGVVVEIIEDDNAAAWTGPAGSLLLLVLAAMICVKLRLGLPRRTETPKLPPKPQHLPVDALKEAAASPERELARLKRVPWMTVPDIRSDAVESNSAEYYESSRAGAALSAGFRVQMASLQAAPQLPVMESELDKLGVSNVESAIAAVKDMVVQTCRTITNEISAVNDWFAKRGRADLDCNNTLQAVSKARAVPTSMMSPLPVMGGFGAPLQPQQAPPRVTKKEELNNWKLSVLSQLQRVDDPYDVPGYVERRLRLEILLDTCGTFLSSSRLQPDELQELQQYVAQRLQTFAAPHRALVTFRNDRGDSTTWREGFPTDSQLLAHVLRLFFKCLEERIRLPHQVYSTRGHDDLTIVLGSSGEPYFYVKCTLGARTQTFKTRQGPDSFFEAFVYLVALGRKNGNMDAADIKCLSLDKIFKY
jgi:hypothetical protein